MNSYLYIVTLYFGLEMTRSYQPTPDCNSYWNENWPRKSVLWEDLPQGRCGSHKCQKSSLADTLTRGLCTLL
jgi:hypothetical protein